MNTAFAALCNDPLDTLPVMDTTGADDGTARGSGTDKTWAAFEGFCWAAFNRCWSTYVKASLAELNRQIAAYERQVHGVSGTVKLPRHLTATPARIAAMLTGAWLESPATVACGTDGPTRRYEVENRQAINAVLVATSADLPPMLRHTRGLPVMDHLARSYSDYDPDHPDPDRAGYVDTVRRYAGDLLPPLPADFAPRTRSITQRYLSGALPKDRHLYERLNALMEAFFADEYAKLARLWSKAERPEEAPARPVPFIDHLPWWSIRRPDRKAVVEGDYLTVCSATSAQWFIDFLAYLEAKHLPSDEVRQLSAERDRLAVAMQMTPPVSAVPAVEVVAAVGTHGVPSEAVVSEQGFLDHLRAFRASLVEISGEHYVSTNLAQLRGEYAGEGEVARAVELFLHWLAVPGSVEDWQVLQRLRQLPEWARPAVYAAVWLVIWQQAEYLLPGDLLRHIDSDLDDDPHRGEADDDSKGDDHE